MPRLRDSVTDTIRQRIIAGLHEGTLEYGDRLPSARQLSHELGADPRLILAAYHELSEEDYVELRRRSGVYVAARRRKASEAVATPMRWMVDLLVSGLARDIPAPELPERISQALTTLRLRAVVLECNSDQMHSMCRELREDYGLEATGIDLESVSNGAEYPLEMRRADLIISAGHRQEVRRIADDLHKPFVITSVRPDLITRAARLITQGEVYFLVVDPRFALKLRRIFDQLPSGENFRALVIGRDDLSVIRRESAVYIMRAAREQLGERPIPGRLVPWVRVFSDETARELFTIIVRGNTTAAAGKLAAD